MALTVSVSGRSRVPHNILMDIDVSIALAVFVDVGGCHLCDLMGIGGCVWVEVASYIEAMYIEANERKKLSNPLPCEHLTDHTSKTKQNLIQPSPGRNLPLCLVDMMEPAPRSTPRPDLLQGCRASFLTAPAFM